MQIVRADLKELVELPLGGAPYGYTPFCDSRTEMEGFRLVVLSLTSLVQTLMILFKCVKLVFTWCAQVLEEGILEEPSRSQEIPHQETVM